MEGCIFCSIVEGKTPSFKVFENPQFLVTLDINPATKGHLIVIPKMHYKHVIEMPEPEYQGLCSVARALMVMLVDYGAKGVNLLYSIGEAAGQRSSHLIMHVIPRYDNDKVHLVWEPQKLTESDFRAIQSAIAAKINTQGVPQQIKQEPQQMPQPVPEQPKQEPTIRIERRTGAY